MSDLCTNCGSSLHARCCARCGSQKFARGRAVDGQIYCTAACEKEQAHADKLSDAMERELQSLQRSKKPSPPQLVALGRVKAGAVRSTDLNNGVAARSYRWLLQQQLIAWGPQGLNRLELTPAGQTVLDTYVVEKTNRIVNPERVVLRKDKSK